MDRLRRWRSLKRLQTHRLNFIKRVMTAHFLDVPRLYVSNEVGFTRPQQAWHEWEQRKQQKRLELMAEFKRLRTDTHNFIKRVTQHGPVSEH
jgi:hypothetical protein